MATVNARMFQRRDTAAEWTSVNPVMGPGEIGFETDTGLMKIGNGSDAWNDLPGFQEAVAEAAVGRFESQTPGTELAFVERTTGFTTTNTTAGATAGDITGLIFDVTGNGRAVDVEFYAPSVVHSVAGTAVAFVLIFDDALLGPMNQTGLVQTPNPTPSSGGESVYIKRRVVIPEGTTVNVKVNVRGAAAGTVTMNAADYSRISLSATSR